MVFLTTVQEKNRSTCEKESKEGQQRLDYSKFYIYWPKSKQKLNEFNLTIY